MPDAEQATLVCKTESWVTLECHLRAIGIFGCDLNELVGIAEAYQYNKLQLV